MKIFVTVTSHLIGFNGVYRWVCMISKVIGINKEKAMCIPNSERTGMATKCKILIVVKRPWQKKI